VNLRSIIEHKYFRPTLAALLAALAGVVLSDHVTTRGEWLVRRSYDNLFRFDRTAPTNNLVLVLMDNNAYDYHKQKRGDWDRALHTKLLKKRTDDGASLVVFDVMFREPKDPTVDAELADAIRRHGRVVLLADQAGVAEPTLVSAGVIYPTEPFLSATTNFGVGWLTPDSDGPVRRHWPFLPLEPYLSLPRAAAQLSGTKISDKDSHRWIRYYKEGSAWTNVSYHLALDKGPGYFRDRVVFVGNSPATTLVQDVEKDKFQTPYTRLVGTGAARAGTPVGGVEILATEYLNLINRDWSRRFPWWVDVGVLFIVGCALGVGFARTHRFWLWGLVPGSALLVTVVAASLSLLTNYWFPWLIIIGAQIPCAALCAAFLPRFERLPEAKTTPEPATVAERPDAPDYEFFDAPFGQGAFGKVWLVRNAIGEWQALKVIHQAKFKENPAPYDREFAGIQRYKPLSHQHPGLLSIDFISRKRDEGYFYYAMELGDSDVPGWEENPTLYKPRDLSRWRETHEGRRLAVEECVSIGLTLCDALEFLHGQGLAHRDIKPSNVIFVKGRPKLADVGLITEIRPPEQVTSWYGTPGYLPPSPEPPGTVQADIYALGMVLYVISTGRNSAFFPEIATTLLATENQPGFMFLNPILLKACNPAIEKRYQSATLLREALLGVQQSLKSLQPAQGA